MMIAFRFNPRTLMNMVEYKCYKKGWECNSLVEHLNNMVEAMCSIQSIAKKKKRRRRGERKDENLSWPHFEATEFFRFINTFKIPCY